MTLQIAVNSPVPQAAGGDTVILRPVPPIKVSGDGRMAHQVDRGFGDDQQVACSLMEKGVTFIRAGRVHLE